MQPQTQQIDMRSECPSAQELESALTAVFENVGVKEHLSNSPSACDVGRWSCSGKVIVTASLIHPHGHSWMIDVRAVGVTGTGYELPLFTDRLSIRSEEHRTQLRETVRQLVTLWGCVTEMPDRPNDPLVFLRPLIEAPKNFYFWRKDNGTYRLELPNLVGYLSVRSLGVESFFPHVWFRSQEHKLAPFALAILDYHTGNRCITMELLDLSGLNVRDERPMPATETGQLLRSYITGSYRKPPVPAELIGMLLYGHLVSLTGMYLSTQEVRGGKP